jgi:hypothetical protein
MCATLHAAAGYSSALLTKEIDQKCSAQRDASQPSEAVPKQQITMQHSVALMPPRVQQLCATSIGVSTHKSERYPIHVPFQELKNLVCVCCVWFSL